MTSYRDSEMTVAAWLEEGPTDLPDATRRAILAALPTTPQASRGGFAPGYRTLPHSGRLGLAAIAAAAVLGGVIYLIGSQRPTAIPSPTPPASSVPVVSATPLASGQRRVNFFPAPFAYTIPTGATVVVSPTQAGGFWQFRRPDPDKPDNYTAGLIVRSVRGGHSDPCREESPIVDFASGARPVMDYLATVPTVSVGGVREITIDGRPGLEAELHVGAATSDCPNLWLWDGEGSITENGGHEIDVDIRVIDIEGRHIAIYTLGDTDWWPTAQQLVDSFRFDAPRPSSSPNP